MNKPKDIMNKVVNGKSSPTYYTVSTMIFSSLAEAEKQLQKWNDKKELDPKTKIFEITGDIYEPRIKLEQTSLEGVIQNGNKEVPF